MIFTPQELNALDSEDLDDGAEPGATYEALED